MRPVSQPWPNTPSSKGILFIAQLMQEMLRPDTFESFRVHSLDTIARLEEILDVFEDVSSQRLPLASIEPMIKEAVWSLNRDPVVDSIAPDHLKSFVDIIASSDKRDLQALRSTIIYLLKKISPHYQLALENKIVDLHDDAGRKTDIRLAVATYCTHLINRGYSKLYLASTVQAAFFSKPIKRTGVKLLHSLFRSFPGVDRRYKVTTKVSFEFGKYLERLPGTSVMIQEEVNKSVIESMSEEGEVEDIAMFFVMSVVCKDPFTAAYQVENYLSSVRAMTFLARRGIPFNWSKSKYVTLHKSNIGGMYYEREIRLQHNSVPTGRRIKALHSQSNQILNSFDRPSTERIISSINTCALARSTLNSENRLISLWSSFEVLLSDPPPNTPRISHYVKLLVPCICAKYARRSIIAVYDELKVGYRLRLQKLMRRLPTELGIDEYTRFTHLVFSASHTDLQQALFQQIKDNPLAMHRIWKLSNDFGTADNLRKSLESHQNRVEWQLHRIYRARNHLVHSGRIPPYISSLVLNAFEYYRSAIGSILGAAGREAALSDIDQIVAEIFIEYDIYRKRLKAMKSANIAPGDFQSLLT